MEENRIYILFSEGIFTNKYTYYEAVLSVEDGATLQKKRQIILALFTHQAQVPGAD
jgi:hypothetical protein